MNKIFTRVFVIAWDLLLLAYLALGIIGAVVMYSSGFNLIFVGGYFGGVVALGMLSLFVSMYDKICEIAKK
jgi:hypothetical protein